LLFYWHFIVKTPKKDQRNTKERPKKHQRKTKEIPRKHQGNTREIANEYPGRSNESPYNKRRNTKEQAIAIVANLDQRAIRLAL